MPTLIACLSTGKGTWSEVSQLLKAQPWSKVFLITNEFGKQNFTARQDNVELLVVNSEQEVPMLVHELKQLLKDKISDFEVAVNFVSGSGKEHMALLETVLEMGLNFRLVTVNNNHLQILGMER
ncbi:MAG TPA: hypothetical protein VJC21_03460 [Candidatus Nanoarchaeia archaeon]|nr:hypothetical protein [Candidatus Nanoarchaeia archaeon]